VTFRTFFKENLRWLAGGVLLTFFSSVGQTFFIASFAGQIRDEFALSHGGFGLIYMLATLGSAATLVVIGPVVDRHRVAPIALVVIGSLALAALIMASASTVAALLIAIYLLRLSGQGMMSHVAMTAMGRWYAAERGRAVSVATTGHQLGEGILPAAVVFMLAFGHWRDAWLSAAVILIVVAMPLAWLLLSVPRRPTNAKQPVLETGVQWTRREAISDYPFWVICSGVLAPSFIGTSVFFHQVHLGAMKSIAAEAIAVSFTIMSITTVIVGLMTGHLVDRFSARRMLPFYLFPLSIGCIVLSYGQHSMTMVAFMFLLGMSYGVSNAVFGAIWPEVYGIRHLGAIRAVTSAAMVFASALGPGLTGWLIDVGVPFSQQLLFMSAYCLLTMLTLFIAVRQLDRRLSSPR